MRELQRAFAVLVGLALSLAASGQVVGDLRVHELKSTIFRNTRSIRVLVPAGYDAPENADRHYPVIYFNDGQNLFDANTSVFNKMEWRVDETVADLTRRGVIPPLIVVGIDTVGRRGRATEYLPYEDVYLKPPEPNVHGKDYPAFVVSEVMPFVAKQYRVSNKPEETAIGGSSYGAVAALYTAVHAPGRFGKLLLESPSLYVGEGKLLEDVSRTKLWPGRVYIGVGTNEGGRSTCDPTKQDVEAVEDVKQLEKIIRASGEAKLLVRVEPCATHNEAAWAARLPKALEFLFAAHNCTGVAGYAIQPPPRTVSPW